MQYALQGNKGETITADYRGELVFAIYDYIPSLELGLVTKIDKKEVFVPITTLNFIALITVCICSALAICFGFLYSFSLSDIIRKLKVVTEKVAAGNLKERVPVRSNNELGDLARSFNRMADTLATEINNHRITEALLCENKEILRSILENTTTIIYLKDMEGRHTFVNKEFERKFNITRDQIIGKTNNDLFPEDVAGILNANDKNVLSAKASLEFEETVPLHGKLLTYISVKFPLFDNNGTPYSICGVSTDITERKQIETTLRGIAEIVSTKAGKETIQMLVKHIAHSLNADYTLVAELIEDNTKAQTIAICANGEIKDNFIYNLAKTPCESVMAKQTCFDSHNVQQEFPEDKLLIEMGINNYIGIPLLNFNKQPIGILVTLFTRENVDFLSIENTLKIYEMRVSAELIRMKNEEEQARLKEQLYHAQRMESVGRIAGGIAHDFNNILTAIIGYTNIMQMKTIDDSELNGYVQKILTSSEKAARLTQNLLTFSRKQIIQLQPINLNTIVKNAEVIIEQLIREDIVYKILLHNKNLPIMADSGQIEQSLINLVSNAKDAMPEGGALTIRTDSTEFDNAFIQKHGFGKPGEYALLSVSDTGTGIPDEIMKKIFDPFYTTKEMNKGTGLGLSIVYGIINQHNGYIDVQSKPGNGSTFILYLPITE